MGLLQAIFQNKQENRRQTLLGEQIQRKNEQDRLAKDRELRDTKIKGLIRSLEYTGDEGFAEGIRELKDLTGFDLDVNRIVERRKDFSKSLNNYEKFKGKYPDDKVGAQRLLRGMVSTYGNLPSFNERTQGLPFTAEKPPKALESKTFGQSNKLRTQYLGLNKTFRNVRNSYARIQASSEQPSAAGDLALIFNYMKMLDPTSVVRESEFATAAATGSWGNRLKAAGLRMLEGKRLSPEMRKDFVDRSSELFKRSRAQYKQTQDVYSDLAEGFGLDPKQVVIDLDDPLFKEEESSGEAGRKQLSGRSVVTPSKEKPVSEMSTEEIEEKIRQLTGGK